MIANLDRPLPRTWGPNENLTLAESELHGRLRALSGEGGRSWRSHGRIIWIKRDKTKTATPVGDGRFWLYPGIDPLSRGTRPQYHRRVEA